MGDRKDWYWKLIYITYPSFLRCLEKLSIHSKRQPFLQGNLNSKYDIRDLEFFLREQRYHQGVLSWRDPGEVLNLRKLEGNLYQYHIRVFDDGEIRAHYEYSSEGRPLQHILETHFEPRHNYFQELLGDYLIRSPSETIQ